MSHFYATIDGGRAAKTVTGHKTSGISGHVRGWNVGIKVNGSYEDGRNVFRVYLTGGSNQPDETRQIGTFTHEDFEAMTPEKAAGNGYNVFIRDWWIDNPSWPNGLEPCAGDKESIGEADTEQEAQEMCQEYNDSHDPGRFSRKAEYEDAT